MDNWKITFGGQPVTLVGTHLLPGDRAPRFEVLDGNLQPVASTQFKDKTMIISVFPSVDTSVCALQNIRFNREAARLDKDVVILSLSVDLPFAQKRFCAAEHIDNVRVYSDYRDLDFGMKYGFVIKELRLLGRGAVVVDRKGIVRYRVESLFFYEFYHIFRVSTINKSSFFQQSRTLPHRSLPLIFLIRQTDAVEL